MYNINQAMNYRSYPQQPSEHERRVESQVNQLHELVLSGDTEACCALVRQNPQIVNCIKKDVGSALHCAAVNGKAEVIKNLIEMGASVDRCYRDFTPLHVAVCKGRTEAVKALLEKGANPEGQPDGGGSPGPLHDACQNGDIEIVQALLGAGASFTRHDYEGLQALHCAADHDNPDLIQLLLDAGARPDMLADNWYRTPIHRAASCGNLRTVKTLLAGGADPNGFRVSASCCARVPATNHFPPIAFAIINNRCDVVAELVQAGADLKSSVKIREAMEEVERSDMNPLPEHSPDYNPCARNEIAPSFVITRDMLEVYAATMDDFSSAAAVGYEVGEADHRQLRAHRDREREEQFFGKLGRSHPVFDGTMEPLKYSVCTERAEIIGLLLSSGKYSGSEIASMKDLAKVFQLPRALEALNKNSVSHQPGSANMSR